MGRKRKCEVDVADCSDTPKRKQACIEEYNSDESLHLPDSIYEGEDISSLRKEKRKEKKRLRLDGNGLDSNEAIMDSACENGREHCDTKNFNSESTSSGRFEFYLIRKPVEVSLEQLSDSRIPIRSCLSKEEMVSIGGKCFVAQGGKTPAQMFHIPADIVHSSQNPWFTGLDNRIRGFVMVSRAELCNSTAMSEDDGSTPNFSSDLLFKVIRKKVSRKGLRNLKQRLHANGVKKHR